ncbi:cation efflux family protein [Streptococcus gordonii]|nr:cation efflux family protein [Streptococcus gordonii]
MNNPSKNLKLAEQGALLAIVTYILLSTAKLIAGSMLHSSSLTADGFNNISDIVANIAVLIGLRMARKPADMDHKFGHWKIEDLASLITSLIMFFCWTGRLI